MFRLKEKLLGVLLLTAILPFQGLLYCFAVSENSGQWSFGDSDNYILDDTIQVAAGAASLKANNNPVAWYNTSWVYRKPITVNNSGGSDLSDYQIKVVLNAANFDYPKAKTAGADIRLTDSDGVSLLDYWIEAWNNNGDSVVWAKIPVIAAGASKTVYLYYGNSAATSAESGDNTFDFFDDFSSPSVYSGYYTLSEPSLGLEIDQPWEQVSGIGPHTMSIVEWNHDGYRYWAYYGLGGGQGIGLARSNDLMTWTKYENNPLFLNGRWASAVIVGNQVYFSYTKDFEVGDQITHLVLMRSDDGINFETVKTLVPKVAGQGNQNSNLFYNPNDGKYYLYWYNGVPGTWYIKARSADNIENLDTAETITLLSDDAILAAPNMMYYDGTYFLSTESVGAVWQTEVYGGTSPLGPFTKLSGNPILVDHSACMFQHIFNGTTLLVTYCHIPAVSHVDVRTADLIAGRVVYRFPNEGVWTRPGDTWTVVQTSQPDGAQGFVVNTNIYQTSLTYTTNFSGTDYVVEAYGKHAASRTWGLGLRVQDARNFYSTNLYKSPDNIIYTYRWVDGGGQFIGGGGTVNIPADTWLKMSAKVYDNHIDIYFNDILRSQITDASNTYPSGKVALYAEGGATPQVTQFDNFFVHQYAAVEPTVVVGSESMVYSDANPTIQASADNSFVFNRLYSFVETATKNGGEIKYVLSNNGGSAWLYYNNGWIASDGSYSQSNTAAEIQNSIQSFPTGEQRFVFRTFFHSSGIQSVSLDNLVVTGGLFTASSVKSSIVSVPQSSIVAPLSDQLLFLNQIAIEGVSSDNGVSSIQKVEISTDNGLNWSDVVPLVANNHYGFDWKYAWTPSVPGTYRLLTRATSWNGVVESGNSGLTLNIISKTDESDNQNQPTRSILSSVLAPATSQTEIQAQITTIQQQIVVLIQQLIAQLLVELQALL